jgi:hypothetical protein
VIFPPAVLESLAKIGYFDCAGEKERESVCVAVGMRRPGWWSLEM